MLRSPAARLAPLALVVLIALAGPARALPPTRTQVILRQATSPADLRARLATYADSAQASDKIGAGEAWAFIGDSFARGTRPDSAIAAFRRAMDLRGTYEDRYALAAALLARQAPGDIDAGVALATAGLTEARAESARTATRFQALLAWGQLLAGDKDASRQSFEEVESSITLDPLWRGRVGRAVLTGPDTPRAIQLLEPLAVASRSQAEDVMPLLEMCGRRINQMELMDKDIAEKMAARDRIEDRVVTRLEARRIKFAARDGFPLSGVLLEAPDKRAMPAIVMLAPEDTIADFDTLAIALKARGLHTLLVAARGSGWSVGPTCALPYHWRGREEAMLRRSALDVRDAIRALALAVPRRADTTGVVLVASRSMALAGAIAAAEDRRIRALVLLSPDPDPVDRGTLVATLARRRIPVFIQQTMEDYPNFEVVDDAYHASSEARSRVSDGRTGGHGAVAFRMDRKVTPRFVEWLKEALSAPAPAATPRAGSRRG